MDKKAPEVVIVPDLQDFALQMVDAFLKDAELSIQPQDNETPIDVIISVPELHLDFTLWLINLLRESSHEDLGSPKGTILN